jgi:hypothetical protein
MFTSRFQSIHAGMLGSETIISAPSQITAGQWTLTDSPSAGGDTLSLNITALPYDGGSALTALQYRVGGGSVQTLSGLGTGVRQITVLASTAAAVEVRSVNAIGPTDPNVGWSDVKTVTPTVTAVAVPVNTALPTISGTTTQGQTLTASTGTWSNSPSSYAYQWKRSGTNISGATASTYLLVSGDVGATITVAVVASNAGGAGTAATSAATAAIASSGPAPSALDAGQWGASYSQAAAVSTLGAGPYTITGLPYGLTGTVSGGVLTVTGTPA